MERASHVEEALADPIGRVVPRAVVPQHLAVRRLLRRTRSLRGNEYVR